MSTDGLYTGKDDTAAKVLTRWRDGFNQTPIGKATTGFFSVQIPSGACPNWSVHVDYLNVMLDLSQYFCSTAAMNMMQLAGAVLMFITALIGFRWAVL